MFCLFFSFSLFLFSLFLVSCLSLSLLFSPSSSFPFRSFLFPFSFSLSFLSPLLYLLLASFMDWGRFCSLLLILSSFLRFFLPFFWSCLPPQLSLLHLLVCLLASFYPFVLPPELVHSVFLNIFECVCLARFPLLPLSLLSPLLQDKSSNIRELTARCMASCVVACPGVLEEADKLVQFAMTGLGDEVGSVRYAFAGAIGRMLAACVRAVNLFAPSEGLAAMLKKPPMVTSVFAGLEFISSAFTKCRC